MKQLSPSVALSDKYELPKGRVFMTGTQALVRLMLAQKARDEAVGLRTGGFVSGYRGSPVGAVDQEMWKAKKYLEKNNITFTPGLNEELAATAVWGSQMVSLDPKAKVEGVFSMWYGKGPGVDRSGDVFKHANLAGTARNGGVLAIVGDDHNCKSSTLPHQSEQALIAAMMPVLNPSGVREFIEFGLHGWAMSRFSGCWVGFKSISDTIETASSFEIDPLAVDIRVPDTFAVSPLGLSIRLPDTPLEQERRLMHERMQAVLAYVRLNRLNRQPWDAPRGRLGIVTTGKSYLDTREALELLGIDEDAACRIGLRLLKIGVSWPLEPTSVSEFAQGLEEILVIEEKRALIEPQIKDQLYNARSRPRVIGKRDDAGEWSAAPGVGFMLPPNGELTPVAIAHAIVSRIALVIGEHALPERARAFLAESEATMEADPTLPQRLPYFCSGCPHNTSTKVPEGSVAMAGIGCHGMVTWMNRNTPLITQMGGEGAAWIGQTPFTQSEHLFVNLGDGTFNHSGSLAVRAAVAAKVNITYKILANDAVAMTGGQSIEGGLSAIDILCLVAAEGVQYIHLVSDEPEAWQAMGGIPRGTVVSHRDRLDEVQRELREKKGVSVIVYAQTCAAEKRRRRKRQEMADPPKRVVINEEVCEGCGDCGVQSNCVSIMPLETELGRKRAIDQSSCNKDYSCVKGFCPSFVTVEGGQPRKPAKAAVSAPVALPAPMLPLLGQPYNILITGVGGTGVVTIGALMGMAAHIEGKGVVILDMAGVAQKGGAVLSYVRLAARPEAIHSARVASGQADLLLGCDVMVAAAKDTLAASSPRRTVAVLNTYVTPTGSFTQDPDWQARPEAMQEKVRTAVRLAETVDATHLATALTGDAVATNVFMLGFAWQKGLIPLEESSLLRAIELNAVAIEMNKAAFAWGRQAALDLAKVQVAAGGGKGAAVIAMPRRVPTLDALIADRMERLTAYQNIGYAKRYQAFVREIADAEKAVMGTDRLAREVGVSLYKLMAYKDEYEVARLYVESGFFDRVRGQFEGDYRLRFHLAPPLLAKKDAKGHLIKTAYGPWIATAFKWLAKVRWLRGSPLDIFGYTLERRGERALIGEYMAVMRNIVRRLTPDHVATAMELARLPQTIRGFGHVKEENLKLARARQSKLLAALDEPVARMASANAA